MTSSISGIGGGFSSSTLKKLQEDMFKTADKNGDGTISKDELSQLSESDTSQSSTSTDDLFAQMDADNSGAISRLESDAAIAKAGHMHQGPPPPPPEESSDSSSDSTGTDTSTIFDAMDTNEDGKVSASELAAALAKSGDGSSGSTRANPLERDFKALSTALQSGSVADAQNALTALQKDVSSQNGGSSDDPFSDDLQSLSDALQSGSLSGAQTIFASIQDKLASGPPQMADSTQAETADSGSQDTVATTLQALLDAVEKSSSTTDDSDSNSTLKNILTAALQSYMQQSSSTYAQSAASGTSLSSTV